MDSARGCAQVNGTEQTHTATCPRSDLLNPCTSLVPSSQGELPFSAARQTNDSFWAHLQKDLCRRTLFDAALATMTQHAAPALAEALDEAIAAAEAHHAVTTGDTAAPVTVWPPSLVRPGKCVCDIGGGGGSGKGASPLLAAVLARHPGTKGVVYDLAEAVKDDALPLSGWEMEDAADVEALEAKAEAAVQLGGGMLPLLEGLSLWPGLGKRGTSLADARRRIRRVSGSFLNRGEVLAKLSGGRCDLFILKVRDSALLGRFVGPMGCMFVGRPRLITHFPLTPNKHSTSSTTGATRRASPSSLTCARPCSPIRARATDRTTAAAWW